MEGSQIPHPRIGSNGRVSDPPLRQQNSIRCNLLLLYIIFIYFKIASLRYEIAGLIDSFDSYGHVSARRATTWAFIGEHSFSFDMDCALRTKTIELRVASGGFLQVICIIIYCLVSVCGYEAVIKFPIWDSQFLSWRSAMIRLQRRLYDVIQERWSKMYIWPSILVLVPFDTSYDGWIAAF